MTLIARFYQQESKAQAARQDLLNMGYGPQEITLIEPVKPQPNAAGEMQLDSAEVDSRAMQAAIQLGQAPENCISNLEQGQSLLVVKAPFGYAKQTIYLVDRNDPVAEAAPGTAYPDRYRLISERAAPLSDFLRLKVLTGNQGSVKDFLGLPTLTGNRSFLTGPLTMSNWSLSSMFFMGLLSSSLLTNPSLSKPKSGRGWTRSFGFRMLIGNVSPLSSLFGIPLVSGRNALSDYSSGSYKSGISQRTTTLSALLGWNPLARKPLSLLSSIMPPLARSDFALFGSGKLMNNPAPLSSLTDMPLLSGKSGDQWKSSHGFALLSDNPAPLSSRLGMPTKSDYRTFYNP